MLSLSTVNDNSEVLLNDLSIHDFSVFRNSPNEMWSDVILSNNCPNMMKYIDCQSANRVILTDIRLSNFLVIEMSPSIMNRIQFESRITIKEKIFQLSALVKNDRSHYKFAVMERNGNILRIFKLT